MTTAVPTVSVSGHAKMEVKPDMATTNFTISAQNQETAAKASEAIGPVIDAVRNALQKGGIAEDDIQTSVYHVYETYKYDSNGNRVGAPKYTAETSLKVTVRNLDTFAAIVDAAVAAGATSTYGVSYGLQDPQAHEAEVLALALENAKTRADAMAAVFSKQVGDVLLLNDGTQISETVYLQTNDLPQAEMAMADDAGYGPALRSSGSISVGTIEVRATVSARFTLK